MSAETWGLLAKSQSDSTTIDQAIAAAIADHEADSSAHLGSGESLESHRASDILDHPEGSVVADKLPKNGIVFNSVFENLAYFTQHGQIDKYGEVGVRLTTDASVSAYAELLSVSDSSRGFIVYTSAFQFQIAFQPGQDLPSTIKLLFGRCSSRTLTAGIGWEISDTSTKVRWKDATHDLLSDELGALSYDYHTLRVRYEPVAGELYVYIDGTLVYTFSDPGMVSSPYYCDTSFSVTATTSDGASIDIESYQMARDV